MTPAETTIINLQKRVSRLQLATLAMGAGLAVVMLSGFVGKAEVQNEVRAHRIVLVDSRGVERVVLGEDAGRRHGRSAAIWIYDETGNERGGLGTFENGQASFALDAPAGVGAAMPDRLGLRVDANGEAVVQLNNNDTGVPVRLIANAEGGGGLELIAFDQAARQAHIRRLTAEGETVRQVPLGG